MRHGALDLFVHVQPRFGDVFASEIFGVHSVYGILQRFGKLHMFVSILHTLATVAEVPPEEGGHPREARDQEGGAREHRG